MFALVLAMATAMLGGARAEDRMQATLDAPAVVRANLTGHLMTDSPGPPRVYLSIVAFTPPPDRKPVEIVVSAARVSGGPPRELGRVAIVPYRAFGVKNKARQQYFAFAVPADFASDVSLTISVALVPANGGGKGARLQVGDASIR